MYVDNMLAIIDRFDKFVIHQVQQHRNVIPICLLASIAVCL